MICRGLPVLRSSAARLEQRAAAQRARHHAPAPHAAFRACGKRRTRLVSEAGAGVGCEPRGSRRARHPTEMHVERGHWQQQQPRFARAQGALVVTAVFRAECRVQPVRFRNYLLRAFAQGALSELPNTHGQPVCVSRWIGRSIAPSDVPAPGWSDVSASRPRMADGLVVDMILSFSRNPFELPVTHGDLAAP